MSPLQARPQTWNWLLRLPPFNEESYGPTQREHKDAAAGVFTFIAANPNMLFNLQILQQTNGFTANNCERDGFGFTVENPQR